MYITISLFQKLWELHGIGKSNIENIQEVLVKLRPALRSVCDKSLGLINYVLNEKFYNIYKWKWFYYLFRLWGRCIFMSFLEVFYMRTVFLLIKNQNVCFYRASLRSCWHYTTYTLNVVWVLEIFIIWYFVGCNHCRLRVESLF